MKAVWIVLMLCSPLAGLAQPTPDTLWSRRFAGSSAELAGDFQQCDDGGYLLAGEQVLEGFFVHTLIHLIRTDANGDVRWERIYGDSSVYTLVASERRLPDGGFYIAGTTELPGHVQRGYLMRTNGEGDSLWARRYGNDSRIWVYGMERTPDGGAVLVGDYGSSMIFAARTDDQGDTTWTRHFYYGSPDLGNSVAVMPDSGFVFAGVARRAGGDDGLLVRTDSNGDEEWSGYYGDQAGETIFRVITTTDGGLLGVGTSLLNSTLSFYVVKTGPTGSVEWSRTYPGAATSAPVSAIELPGGGYVIGGTAVTASDWQTDYYLLRLNAAGDSLWSRRYHNHEAMTMASFLRSVDGAYVMLGTSQVPPANQNVYMVKTGPDYLEAEPGLATIPRSISLCTYPNPFNPVTTLRFDQPYAGKVKLRVVDVTGRAVTTIYDGVMAPGEHRLQFDGAALPSGVYFANLTVSGEVAVQRMVLLK
jgi:hypothetical protein